MKFDDPVTFHAQEMGQLLAEGDETGAEWHRQQLRDLLPIPQFRVVTSCHDAHRSAPEEPTDS